MLSLCILAHTQIADDIIQNTYAFLDLCRGSARRIELNEIIESFSHFLDFISQSLLATVFHFRYSTAKASNDFFRFFYGCCSLNILDF